VHLLRLFDRAAEARLGLSGAQVFVLEKLREAGRLSVNELAERTQTHQSSVSVVVQKLARRKLLTRSTSASDARRSEIALTPRGEKLLHRAPQAAQSRLIAALLALPARRRKMLADLLVELVEAMGISGETPRLFFEDHQRPSSRKSPAVS
jgi:DNA-binding MarR family transcriptional regulator